MLVEVSRQLAFGIDANPAHIEQRFAQALSSLDPGVRCLIVVDNLETVSDVERALSFIATSSALRPHKVVITTRVSTAKSSDSVQEIQWRGLTSEAAKQFARHLAMVEPGFTPTAEELGEVVEISGGIPLLIKLMMKLAIVDARPVSHVVRQLRSKTTDLGGRVGVYLYAQAVDALSEKVGEVAAVNVMNVFCCRASGESFTREEFYKLSRIPDEGHFDHALAAARNLALVRSIDGNKKFTVHPLLRQFVCE
ncbi:hypothetical protein BBK82_26590 [Lentzea guizhouensis]|uniref:NB-ARC domain-containing protein n=2 Tax=Lentzea guizhouensis TaxID=1586287 RepID=A0A1B2HMZ6_9PSEU|nr:hypothetical protein BBK82_26590 [Lentzea guizhouensis]